MSKIDTEFGPVYQGKDSLEQLDQALKAVSGTNGVVFFLADEHTHEYCLDRLIQELPGLGARELLEVPVGESSKSVEVAAQLWAAMADLGADRQSVIVNVGGGMVCDLGGFVAATYMRGIDYYNVPTSLLAMVDAAIGGKVAVDVEGIKNLAGLFAPNRGTFLLPWLLETLPERELRAGWAEMVKHGLIEEPTHFAALKSASPTDISASPDLISDSMGLKIRIVESDPRESGRRKHLNFGHTLGHALESHFLSTRPHAPLLHGEAVAAGMWLETELSVLLSGLPRPVADDIQQYLNSLFPAPDLPEAEWQAVLDYLRADKKNADGRSRFVLLEKMGRAKADVVVPHDDLIRVLAKWQA